MVARRELEQADIAMARQTSPEAFLRGRYGADVFASRNGRSVRVDHVLRADKRPDGSWVACDWFSQGIGDNIALVQKETGCGFLQAVGLLTGSQPSTHTGEKRDYSTSQARPAIERPRVPGLSCIDEGRSYLMERCISAQTIQAAEECGALSYCRGAVIFLGRDHESPSHEVRLATLRYLVPVVGEDGKAMKGRDLAGTDKAYPLFIPGDERLIAIVEGGTSALAVRDLYLGAYGIAPTVIALGGVGIRHWVDTNVPLQARLGVAQQVVVLGENERGRAGMSAQTKQALTDELRHRLASDIARHRDGELPVILYPPDGIKDVADWLSAVLSTKTGVPALPVPLEGLVPGR
jgi:hypothetical protein